MFTWQIFFSTFLVVFFAELGDKTQLVAFSVTSTTKTPVLIFFATSLALSCSSVLAAFAGKLAAQFIPSFTSYISAGLFLLFGLYILLSKEAPKIKEIFLTAVSQENVVVHMLSKLASRDSANSEWLRSKVSQIIHDEKSHAELFTFLLKKKKLFKDDINEESELDKMVKQLELKKSLLKLPLPEVLDSLVENEKSVVAVFNFVASHLEKSHPDEKEFLNLLRSMLEDEAAHIAFFTEWRNLLG